MWLISLAQEKMELRGKSSSLNSFLREKSLPCLIFFDNIFSKFNLRDYHFVPFG